MPYIPKEDRKKFEKMLNENIPTIKNSGELNYLITKICLEYMYRKGIRYTVMNEVVGALDCAKMEFYRRFVSPYEDEKIEKNGDIIGEE